MVLINNLKEGDKAIIVSVELESSRQAKFEALGFVVGAIVEVEEQTGNNFILKIKGSKASISKKEAEKIFVNIIYDNNSKNKECLNFKKCKKCKKPKQCKNKTYDCNKSNLKCYFNYENIILKSKKILLVGNPNVGKSKIFSKLTGTKICSSNFPGTTVEIRNSESEFLSVFNENFYKIEATVCDIPGLYSLKNNVDEKNAEKIAENAILASENYDLLIYVLDAEILERSLNLALSVLEIGKPVIFILNKYETAKTKGIHINSQLLSEELSAPVIRMEAISGFGLHNLEKIIVETFVKIENLSFPNNNKTDIETQNWDKVSKIVKNVQFLEHRHPNFLDKLSNLCVKPKTGIPIATFVLVLILLIIVSFGEFCNTEFDNLFSIFQNFLGEHINTSNWNSYLKVFLFGQFDTNGTIIVPGVINEGMSICFSVFIYFFIFYLIFETLADTGYLPRLAVLMDSLLHKIGIHGYGIIPILMGFGCKVPAVLSVRVLEKKRERFISLILILLIAPCISCSGMILRIAGEINISNDGGYLMFILTNATIFFTIFFIGIIAGFLLNKIKKGNSTEIFMEIPPLSFPRFSELYLKMSVRIKELVLKTLPFILIGVAFFNLLFQFKIIDIISNCSAIKFVISDLLGLPINDAFNIIFGFLRKDAAIGLLTINTNKELIIASIFMSLYLPCTATIIMIKREFSWKETISALGITFFVAFLISTAINFIL